MRELLATIVSLAQSEARSRLTSANKAPMASVLAPILPYEQTLG